ncbi:MAG: DUF418 domain-containing protein [Acidobacteria bacterium]|nr:DUF418 domain-containing protein [Acidobacteriota bacterium]
MSENTEALPLPVAADERIEALDVVRGFALLGILLMNICSFGMPMIGESNPRAWGGSDGANYVFWWVQYVFWSGKMRALFSLCFGAGVIYLTSRAEAKGATAGDIYYRRTFWLMFFGVIHAHLIWYGDILYPYALMGLFLYPLRSLNGRLLTAFGVALIVITTVHGLSYVRDLREARDKSKSFPEHAVLDSANHGYQSTYRGRVDSWLPSKEALEKEIKIYREGPYSAAYNHRVGIVQGWTAQTFYAKGWWDILSMMLIGMGLAKLGAFAGRWPTAAYVRLSILCLLAGGIIGGWAANHEAGSGFDVVASTEGYSAYQPLRLMVAFGYFCGLVAIVKAGVMQWLISPLAAVGRMAFTNYIMHSLICTTIFYSHGFALFGKLERWELHIVVAGVWIFQLIVSPIWLRHFRFGPLEWCWRSLTYWKRQPMRIAAPVELAAVEGN